LAPRSAMALKAMAANMMPSTFAAQDLLAYVVDLAGARGPRAFAALRARAAVAARADDAGRRSERIRDPGEVEHIGHGAERLRWRLRDACLAAPVQALAENGIDQRVAAHAVRGECGREVHAHGQHVRVSGHVVHADRMAAVEERALGIAQHRDLRAARPV